MVLVAEQNERAVVDHLGLLAVSVPASGVVHWIAVLCALCSR